MLFDAHFPENVLIPDADGLPVGAEVHLADLQLENITSDRIKVVFKSFSFKAPGPDELHAYIHTSYINCDVLINN